MAKKDVAFCVTKKSVEHLIEILGKSIELLEIQNELLVSNDDIKKNHELIKEAIEEKKTYEIVKDLMDKKGHKTLCMKTSDINRKGKITIVDESEDE